MNRKDVCYAIYTRLLKHFPEKPWEKSVLKLGKNPNVSKIGENLISYGLYLLEIKDFEKYDEYDHNAVSDATLYTAKMIEFYEELQPGEQASFKARWEAAFFASNDMRALSFEIFVYYALKSCGWDVEHKDNSTAGETYDYLASRRGGNIQVECKSFSYDKGLIINNKEASELANKILCSLSVENNEKEIHIINLKISKRLPDDSVHLAELYTEICDRVNSCHNFHDDRFSIAVCHHVDAPDMLGRVNSIIPIKSDEIEMLYIEPENRESKNRIILRITTVISNSFWREFEKICKDAVKNQFKKGMPATLLIHIYNLDSIKKIYGDDKFNNKIKNIFKHDNIYSVVLVSNTGVYEDADYPYLIFRPMIKEFYNNNFVFKAPGKIFSCSKR